MKQIYSDAVRKILKNKRSLENELKVKLSSSENVLLIKGDPENEFLAEEVIEAITAGFPIEVALLLKEEDVYLKKVNIKSVTSKKDLRRIRGRVIGIKRKSLNTIEELSDCYISLHENDINIIGLQDNIEKARVAIEKLVRGSDHSKVYSLLEKQNADENEFG